MQLEWERFTFDSMNLALGHSYCLYVFHHPQDGDQPFYIGKAKYFCTKQSSGYMRSARYNTGYIQLLAGMLRSGFSLYIAPLSEVAFADAEGYEQELIALWNPVRKQKIKPFRKAVQTDRPWAVS